MFVPLDLDKLAKELTRTDPESLVDRARALARRRAAIEAEEAGLGRGRPRVRFGHVA